jgi:hypothetical protein
MFYDRNTFPSIKKEEIKEMLYGSNAYTTIRQEDIQLM